MILRSKICKELFGDEDSRERDWVEPKVGQSPWKVLTVWSGDTDYSPHYNTISTSTSSPKPQMGLFFSRKCTHAGYKIDKESTRDLFRESRRDHLFLSVNNECGNNSESWQKDYYLQIQISVAFYFHSITHPWLYCKKLLDWQYK